MTPRVKNSFALSIGNHVNFSLVWDQFPDFLFDFFVLTYNLDKTVKTKSHVLDNHYFVKQLTNEIQ